MKEYFRSAIKKYFTCQHSSALISSHEGYCPDCGVYLKKYFYIVRCKCCDIKRDAKMHFENVVPSDKFCTNCGGQEFYVEKHEKINFTDIKFAIHTKEAHKPTDIKPATQVWVEAQETKQRHLKLLKKIAAV